MFLNRYSDLESRMKDELMNVKIKFTEQSQTVAELKQEISRLETKVGSKSVWKRRFFNNVHFILELRNVGRRWASLQYGWLRDS